MLAGAFRASYATERSEVRARLTCPEALGKTPRVALPDRRDQVLDTHDIGCLTSQGHQKIERQPGNIELTTLARDRGRSDVDHQITYEVALSRHYGSLLHAPFRGQNPCQ